MARKPYQVIHADDRHGDGWPKPPGSGPSKNWTGWLTYREYNLIDFWIRFAHNDIYMLGPRFDITHESCNRLFYNMVDAGLIEGETRDFHITPMAKILFDMTDQYILQLELEDEEESA